MIIIIIIIFIPLTMTIIVTPRKWGQNYPYRVYFA